MSASSFSAAGFARGARRSLTVALGLAPFGLVVGVLAAGKGLSLTETGLMSGLVFAGASQILALDLWTHPAPVLAASFAAFAVNLRMALMGPALAPWLERLSGWRLWGNLFLLVDQGFALAIAEGRKGERDGGFLFGVGAALWLSWIACSLAGHLLGATFHPPRGHPLFFAALAAFVSLLVPLWRGRKEALPWLIAAAVALPVARLAPRGAWHVLVAALVGSLIGALLETRRGRR